MKTITIVLVFLLIAVNLIEGQSYRPRGNYAGSGYAGRRRGYTPGNGCPTRPCTLQLIPPECRQREFFVYFGRLCPGCYIDKCIGRDNDLGVGEVPHSFVMPN